MPTTYHSSEFLRAAIEANGWGEIPDHVAPPSTYDANPISEPEGTHEGAKYNVDPNDLNDEQQQLVADCFKLVAACLMNDEDGTYAALLEAMMDGAQ